jgi:hypothetical protein
MDNHANCWFAYSHPDSYMLNGKGRRGLSLTPRTVPELRQALAIGIFVSREAARAVTEGSTREGDRRIYEHAVPSNVLHAMSAALSPLDETTLEASLRANYRIGIVTRDEDVKLKAAGLRHRMPDRCDPTADPWARYRVVGIEAWDGR